MSQRRWLFVGILLVIGSIALVTRVSMRGEYVGEFPKGGFHREKADYTVPDYEPPTPPVSCTVPKLTVQLKDAPPIQLSGIPEMAPLGRLDFSGELSFEKSFQADVLVSVVLRPSNDNGLEQSAVGNVVQMLTPHKHRKFELKLPIPEDKGVYSVEIEILSPDLNPMTRVLAKGVIEVK